MSDHALEVLEFERVLERIAGRASSELGAARVRALRPRSAPKDVERELARVSATMAFLESDTDWAAGPLPDVGAALRESAVDGAVLSPEDLHRIGVVLGSSRLLAGALRSADDVAPGLETIVERLVEDRAVEMSIARSVDAEGSVLDGASRELKRIRDSLRGAHSKIVRSLERYLGELSDRFVVPDASVTIRDGRYVIPVRREGRGEVGGIVHDESQTGATLYVEPPAAIELMNRLRDLEGEEAREIRRILGQLTAQVVPLGGALIGALDALVEFDALEARARVALAWRASVPELASSGEGLRIRDGRHPLLVEARQGPVVPFDVDLEPEERALVVSGPNTGGKSVFLKATGLISALAQSGCIPPVGPGTRLPVFGSFFADIGDEQSIARNLSTFSAHLTNLADIVRDADERSLVLIDEMGTGTDPAEGAALSRSVVEELVAKGATTFVSSHLGELKRLDTPESGIVNASLQFDSERMEPTYRMVKGRPGRSYGLAIARRLGFPAPVLDRAEAYREAGGASLEEVLQRLEAQEQEGERLVLELDRERVRSAKLLADLRDRETALREEERSADQRAREEARRLLMDARGEVEDAIRALRASVLEGEELDEAAREARRRVERAAARLREPGEPSGNTAAGGDVSEGDAVRLTATGAVGHVVEVRDGRALVATGSMRLEVPLGAVERTEASRGSASSTSRCGGWSGSTDVPVRIEVDLRGLRVDEMERALTHALDEALLGDLADLRIIHGKGTGALRKRVAEILKADGRVRSFRMGAPTEGGAGVTVARFS